jgi:hypothetical protein
MHLTISELETNPEVRVVVGDRWDDLDFSRTAPASQIVQPLFENHKISLDFAASGVTLPLIYLVGCLRASMRPVPAGRFHFRDPGDG